MPCATVHLLTAGRTLEAWVRRPAGAPFDPSDRDLTHDFLVGAMAPDMGFVPAADRTVSELVHYIETANVVRALLAHARTEGETAFVWGWATHHMTDVLIHPLVGKAVGEVLYGDRERRVNASANEQVHVSVEVGLDIVVQATVDRIPAPPPTDHLLRGSFDFVARALSRTYGLPFDKDRLTSDLRLAARQLRFWPGLIQRLGRAHGVNRAGQAAGPLGRVLGNLSRLGPDRSAMRGLCTPRRPPEWLPNEVRTIADDFAARFQVFASSGGASLENRNLETGLLEFRTEDHPYSERRREWWRRERSARWRPWTVLPVDGAEVTNEARAS